VLIANICPSGDAENRAPSGWDLAASAEHDPARPFGWHQRKDLNPDERSWRPPCCRYITLAYHREELHNCMRVAVVPPGRFERPTCRVEAGRSFPLSYGGWRRRPVSSRLIAVLQTAAFPFRHCAELHSFPPRGVSSRKCASSRTNVSTTAATERACLFSHVPLVGPHGFEP
jgi:hypothetical protein